LDNQRQRDHANRLAGQRLFDTRIVFPNLSQIFALFELSMFRTLAVSSQSRKTQPIQGKPSLSDGGF
jgi:hypothetical protein